MRDGMTGTEPFETAKISGSMVDESVKFLRERVPKHLEDGIEPSSYCVTFSEKPMSYCIGLVDMVDSTKMTATLGMKKMSRYYQHFLNLMSKVISEFDGCVIKNVGDCLLFYFPSTSLQHNESALVKSLECCLAIQKARDFLCSQMRLEGLPCIDYRISMDYGLVIPMKASDSRSPDMIGPAVNMCTKINRCAGKNEIAIGGDLYEIAKHLDGLSFKEIKGHSVGFKYCYPVYLLARR
jgi:class 3 adenylate cyclase